ncbi:MAG: PAS-domain containing protein [Gammaproteobacteria bacterium]|nr:PAS-domain containing protein [Gammaproteobacteria bacterium]
MISRLGVGGRLMLAFLAISAFAVLAAAAATYPLKEIGRVLDRFTQQRMPAALASQDLSRQAERIVAAAPALLTVSDPAEHAQLSLRIDEETDRLDQLLTDLRNSQTDSTMLEAMEQSVTRLRVNLRALDRLVAERIASEKKERRLVEHVYRTHTNIQQLLAPWLLVLEGEMRQSRQAISGPNVSLEVQAAGAKRLDESIQSLRTLQKAQLQATVVNDLLIQLASAEDSSRINVLIFRIKRSLQELTSISETFSPKLQPLLAAQLSELERLASPQDGLPSTREQELSLVAQATRLLDENRQLSSELTAAVDALLANLKGEAADASTEAQTVQKVSQIILVGAVAVALVSSILIVWLYVGRNLVSRLTALSQSMLAIADGNLDAELPAAGSDEIGRMAQALRSFRDTAVEVRETNLREIREAQSRLTDAIESISEGFSLYDADDRLVVCNTRYRQMLYPDMPDAMEPGTTFEEIIRRVADKRLVRDAAGSDEDWIEQRLSRHRDPGEAHLQQRSDGRWIRINERKTHEGGTVAVYTDITDDKRLEEELRSAKEKAEQALAELTHAQQSLIYAEKMASLGQLTAGIAHEIKNPLNFVNNFAEASAELLEELNEAVASVMDGTSKPDRAAIRELTENLTSFQVKIREHGQRADRIVKSMLAHAREEPGTSRPTEINALIEENLNLAFHSARAENQGFNITIERELDPQVGTIDVFPQELSRVLINVMSNGFYATHKRLSEWKEPDYRPTMTVASKDLDDCVEIRIRDNGTGIPETIVKKIFTPLFTTKPPGEGTGLGLSLSYDTVVQQHGGRMDFSTREGEFTEFIITLPKTLHEVRITEESANVSQNSRR